LVVLFELAQHGWLYRSAGRLRVAFQAAAGVGVLSGMAQATGSSVFLSF
jgi:hypothetical protein